MDAEAEALRAFKGLANYTMPVLMKWALAGTVAIGALVGLIAGFIAGWTLANNKGGNDV